MGSRKPSKTYLERLDDVLDIAASRPNVREMAEDTRRNLSRLLEDSTNLGIIEQSIQLGVLLASLERKFGIGDEYES